jgi:hypothetical protein
MDIRLPIVARVVLRTGVGHDVANIRNLYEGLVKFIPGLANSVNLTIASDKDEIIIVIAEPTDFNYTWATPMPDDLD